MEMYLGYVMVHTNVQIYDFLNIYILRVTK